MNKRQKMQKIINYCFSPIINENARIQSLKPSLLISLLVLTCVILLDYFILETSIYTYLSMLVLPIFIMVLKRFYYIFTIFSLIFIIFVIPKIINDLGTFFQIEIVTTMTIIIFCLKIICLILLLMVYYVFFQYYKELKYIYIKDVMTNIKNIPFDENDDKTNIIDYFDYKTDNSINYKKEN